MEKKIGRFVKSVDTSIIERRLRTTNPGDIVTYDELSKLLGRDVRVHCQGNSMSARKKLEIEDKMFFDTVTNTGYRRLSNEESLACPQSNLSRAVKAARKSNRQLTAIDFESLSDAGKQKHLVTSAIGGAMALFGSSKAHKKLETKIQADPHELAIGETLRLFGATDK